MLTDVKIRALKKAAKQYVEFDGKDGLPGFAVRVSQSGTKAFVLHYRIGRRSRKMTLGRYGVVSLKMAREKAVEALRVVALGRDPQQMKSDARDNYELHLFTAAARTYIDVYAKHTKTWRETERILVKQLAPFFKNQRVGDLDRSQVAHSLDRIGKDCGPAAANLAFAIVRKFFNWCRERGLIETSPCVGMKPPNPIRRRNRVLTDQEVSRIWKAADGMGFPFGPFVMLLLITGQRRIEVARMEWSHLDFGRRCWVQPTNKSDRPHIVPLSKLAIELLAKLPRAHDRYVFPARNGHNPISGFSKWKTAIDVASQTGGWTLHDFRRTVTTYMARELKVPENIADRILNHSNKSRSLIAGIYNKHDYIDERHDALEKWSCYLASLSETELVKDRVYINKETR